MNCPVQIICTPQHAKIIHLQLDTRARIFRAERKHPTPRYTDVDIGPWLQVGRDKRVTLPFIPSDLRSLTILEELQQWPHSENEVKERMNVMQHSNSLGRIRMEGSEWLHKGWLVRTPSQ